MSVTTTITNTSIESNNLSRNADSDTIVLKKNQIVLGKDNTISMQLLDGSGKLVDLVQVDAGTISVTSNAEGKIHIGSNIAGGTTEEGVRIDYNGGDVTIPDNDGDIAIGTISGGSVGVNIMSAGDMTITELDGGNIDIGEILNDSSVTVDYLTKGTVTISDIDAATAPGGSVKIPSVSGKCRIQICETSAFPDTGASIYLCRGTSGSSTFYDMQGNVYIGNVKNGTVSAGNVDNSTINITTVNGEKTKTIVSVNTLQQGQVSVYAMTGGQVNLSDVSGGLVYIPKLAPKGDPITAVTSNTANSKTSDSEVLQIHSYKQLIYDEQVATAKLTWVISKDYFKANRIYLIHIYNDTAGGGEYGYFILPNDASESRFTVCSGYDGYEGDNDGDAGWFIGVRAYHNSNGYNCTFADCNRLSFHRWYYKDAPWDKSGNNGTIMNDKKSKRIQIYDTGVVLNVSNTQSK